VAGIMPSSAYEAPLLMWFLGPDDYPRNPLELRVIRAH
jgi:hypothetical protein